MLNQLLKKVVYIKYGLFINNSSTPKFKGYQRPTAKATPAKGIDIDAVGSINGTPIYDFDITKLDTEEKPWRKPG